jgi:hypothetical protein
LSPGKQIPLRNITGHALDFPAVAGIDVAASDNPPQPATNSAAVCRYDTRPDISAMAGANTGLARVASLQTPPYCLSTAGG